MVKLAECISEDVRKSLRQMGHQGDRNRAGEKLDLAQEALQKDEWNSLLEEFKGDEGLARTLYEIRHKDALTQSIPPTGKIRLKASERVLAQRVANSRGY